MKHILIKKTRDNVGNALEDIVRGERFAWEMDGATHVLEARTDIPFAFKVAVNDVRKGETVVCYGEPIGVASADIMAGECVHIHNLQGRRANN